MNADPDEHHDEIKAKLIVASEEYGTRQLGLKVYKTAEIGPVGSQFPFR